MKNFLLKFLPPLLLIGIAVVVAFTVAPKKPAPVKPELDKSTWRTYADSADKFELRYPPYFGPTRSGSHVYFSDNNNRIVGMEIVIDGPTDPDPSKFSYLGFPQTGQVVVNDISYIEFKAPNGFCEDGHCGRPFSAYSVKHNDKFYTMVFYGDDTLSPEEKVILGGWTFK
ncbi:MAG: hypothetical protein ACM3KM_02515 [Acidobacteriaceae bacterium]